MRDNNKQHQNQPNKNTRRRQGVAGIISGVILVAVLLTSVLVYFVTIANNDKVKTSYEITAHNEDVKRSTEQYGVGVTSISNNNLNVNIANKGPVPIRASQIVLYCIQGTSCTSAVPVASTTISTTINTGSSATQSIGPTTSGNTYRVDVISERGNIVSSSSCNVNGTSCAVPPINLGNLGNNPGVIGAVNEGIIQGTGSLQLDFKAFGALFPQLASRNGVDQTGWKVRTSSIYGSATGYPAFDLPSNLNAVIVEKARNLDPSGQDITLNRNTALIVNVGKSTSGQPSPNYLCYPDKTQQNLTLYPYDETTSYKTILSTTPLNASRTTGWSEIWFCSTVPNTVSTSNNNLAWMPDNKFNNINGIFMVARGTFTQSNSEYAQTIPYQAISVGTAASGNVPDLQACILASNSATSCPSFSTSVNTPSTFKYYETANNLFNTPATRTVYIHVSSANPNPTDPVSVAWVYPDGSRKILAQNQLVNTNNPTRNIQVSIPYQNPDGTKITPGFYTMIVTDSYNLNSARNAYYMTFQVT